MTRTRQQIVHQTASHIRDAPSTLTRDQLEGRLQASLPNSMFYPFEMRFVAGRWVFDDYMHETTAQKTIVVYVEDTARSLAERLAHSIQWHEAASENARAHRGLP